MASQLRCTSKSVDRYDGISRILTTVVIRKIHKKSRRPSGRSLFLGSYKLGSVTGTFLRFLLCGFGGEASASCFPASKSRAGRDRFCFICGGSVGGGVECGVAGQEGQIKSGLA